MNDILFVVHRAAPFPGGSEIYVQNMAEEMLSRGYNVTILAHEHKGDYNGIKITSDYDILLDPKWKLIVVHGGDCISQNVVHQNASRIPSPVLYMIIKPSNSQTCLYAAKHHRFLGYSTVEDFEFISSLGLRSKSRKINHGIPFLTSKGISNYDVGKTIFVSAGGFWPHKGFDELAAAVETVFENRIDVELHLYGYDNSFNKPRQSDLVKTFVGKSHQEVLDAIASADAYIMNSTEEGFGLVLLEAMFNFTTWIARDIAGASVLKDYGTVYNNREQLEEILKTFDVTDKILDEKRLQAYKYVKKHHMIYNTCDDIENVLEEIGAKIAEQA